jgi:anti-sigma factor RsiW
MTPQLVPQQHVDLGATNPSGAQSGSSHLSEEQIDQLLARRDGAIAPDLALAEAHLLVCEYCAAELASLRDSLTLFREASDAYAESQFLHQANLIRPRWTAPSRRPALSHLFAPAYWFAAAAMLMTTFLPMQVLHRHTLPTPQPAAVASVTASPVQSDEALLNDVNSEISASVPSSMQALADPTTDESTVSTDTNETTSTQRKN